MSKNNNNNEDKNSVSFNQIIPDLSKNKKSVDPSSKTPQRKDSSSSMEPFSKSHLHHTQNPTYQTSSLS